MSGSMEMSGSPDGMVSMLERRRVRFTVRVPATSANLGPGFDCMGVALTLFNEMSVEVGEPFTVVMQGEAAEDLPADRSNAVVAAMDLLLSRVQAAQVPMDWKLTLCNRIPVGSGLGSSASAIVGGLLLANALLETYEPAKALTREELLQAAVELEGHPDNVTPALLGGLCLTCPADHGTRTLRLPVPCGLRFVAAIPRFSLFTGDSRQVIPEQIPRADAVYNIAQAARLTFALCSGDLSVLRDGFGDRLHEPYREALIPGYAQVCRSAMEAGAIATTLSGAGPSLLAWCEDDTVAVRVAARMRAAWEACGIPCRTDVYQVCDAETVVERTVIDQ